MLDIESDVPYMDLAAPNGKTHEELDAMSQEERKAMFAQITLFYRYIRISPNKMVFGEYRINESE